MCNVYPNSVGCPYVGWGIGVDTERLAAGSHTLIMTVTTADNRQLTASQTFSTAEGVVEYSLDSPNATTVYTGVQEFGGWVVDGSDTISSVMVFIDGVSQGAATYGAYRPDVCDVFQNYPGCPFVGWQTFVNTSALASGSHTFQIVWTTNRGKQGSASNTFYVQQVPTPEFRILIDLNQINSSEVDAIASGNTDLSADGIWAINMPIDNNLPAALTNLNASTWSVAEDDPNTLTSSRILAGYLGLVKQ